METLWNFTQSQKHRKLILQGRVYMCGQVCHPTWLSAFWGSQWQRKKLMPKHHLWRVVFALLFYTNQRFKTASFKTSLSRLSPRKLPGPHTVWHEDLRLSGGREQNICMSLVDLFLFLTESFMTPVLCYAVHTQTLIHQKRRLLSESSSQ